MNGRRLEELKNKIREKRRLLLAFSGGVDSSLLAAVAAEVLREGAVAVILDSETLPRSELQQARDLAASLGLELIVARFPILQHAAFRENPADRCYICKRESISLLKGIAASLSISCIADGQNQDDLRERRPGMAACREEGVWHPLAEAGMNKEDIRAAAREMGLPVWNKPSSACLATRIAYGRPITMELLGRVEAAEDYLKSLGFRQLRVRMEGRGARVELERPDMLVAVQRGEEIAGSLRAMGFDHVSLDLQGYRSGSMDEVLWMKRE